MASIAAFVAAKLSGHIPVTLGVGRIGYTGTFEPFGQVEAIATVAIGEHELWWVSVEKAHITYTHESPRIITHVGMFIHDRWLIDPIQPEGRLVNVNDMIVASLQYPLPEIP